METGLEPFRYDKIQLVAARERVHRECVHFRDGFTVEISLDQPAVSSPTELTSTSSMLTLIVRLATFSSESRFTPSLTPKSFGTQGPGPMTRIEA